MALTVAQLATDMDVVSASLEAHDVDPQIMGSDSGNYSSTLRVAALRLEAAFQNWLWKGGFTNREQPHTSEVQLDVNNYEKDITYGTPHT